MHASIFVPILLPFWPWWTHYQAYLLYFQEGTRTKYLAYFQTKSKRPPNSANADLEDRIYIYTHTPFPLVSGQGKYILAFFGLYIMRARVSLYSLSLNLLLYSCPDCQEWKRRWSLYSVFREILILKLGDSINSHIYSTNQDVQGLVSWSNYL
jgi:hypothetical protein